MNWFLDIKCLKKATGHASLEIYFYFYICNEVFLTRLYWKSLRHNVQRLMIFGVSYFYQISWRNVYCKITFVEDYLAFFYLSSKYDVAIETPFFIVIVVKFEPYRHIKCRYIKCMIYPYINVWNSDIIEFVAFTC